MSKKDMVSEEVFNLVGLGYRFFYRASEKKRKSSDKKET